MNLFDIEAPATRVIPRVLDTQAAENGDTIWLRDEGRALNFSECARITRRYAGRLSALGIVKGDAVAMVVEPAAEPVLLALAVARLGGIFTMISTDYHGAFLEDAIHQSRARVLAIDKGLAGRLDGLALPEIKHRLIVEMDGTTGLPEAGDAEDVDIDWLDPVQVWWSSGTTGKPKGILHSHSSILHLAHRWVAHKARPGDVFYACTPLYLGSAWNGAIWASLVGGLTVAIDRRFSATHFWDRIRHFGATHFFTLGAMHMHLLKQDTTPADAESGIRYGIAVPMSWDVIPVFKRRFGVAQMDQMYGSSETFMVFEARDDGSDWRGGAMGRPVPHLDVALLDEHDREVPVGEVGEICVRPTEPGVIFLGYYNAPELTVQAWRNLWHHTGDMAQRDEAGVYYFADRKKDYIRYNGRNISMLEVEAVVETHDAIADLAAFGIPSAELESESELALAIVLKPGRALTAEALALHINSSAPYYFVPRYIEFVSEIPRNAHGRVLKQQLRARGLGTDVWDRKLSGFHLRR